MRRTHAMCIFGAPLLVPLVVVGIQRWQGTKLSLYDINALKDDASNERAGLKKVALVIAEDQNRGKVSVRWMIYKKALRPTLERPKELWIYCLVYDLYNKRLISCVKSPRIIDPYEVEATQYDEVSDTAIQAVARDGATCADLLNYGAVLTRRGKATFNDARGPVFQ